MGSKFEKRIVGKGKKNLYLEGCFYCEVWLILLGDLGIWGSDEKLHNADALKCSKYK